MSEMSSRPDLAGQAFTIEQITERLPAYPDGRRPRARAAARRLRPILELVERGPNGSLGRGATYRIVPVTAPQPSEEAVSADLDWLEEAAARMTKGR
jgi:hypothetical protein